MAKTTDEIAARFAGQLFPGEQITVAFDRVTCKFPRGAGACYVALTARRLLVLRKGLGQHDTLSLELSQVVEFTTAGGFIPKLTLATTGGQRVEFTAIAKDKIPLIQQAVGAARAQ